MIREKSQDLVFFAGRDFVHSTLISDVVIRLFNKYFDQTIKVLAATFHRPLQSNAEIVIDEYDKREDITMNRFAVTFIIQTAEKNFLATLQPTGEPIKTVVDYDEDQFTDPAVLMPDNRGVLVHQPSSETIINQIVSLNKLLLSQNFNPDGFSRWYVASYKLNWQHLCSSNNADLMIQLDAVIGKTTTRSIISHDGHSVGNIIFAREKR